MGLVGGDDVAKPGLDLRPCLRGGGVGAGFGGGEVKFCWLGFIGGGSEVRGEC